MVCSDLYIDCMAVALFTLNALTVLHVHGPFFNASLTFNWKHIWSITNQFYWMSPIKIWTFAVLVLNMVCLFWDISAGLALKSFYPQITEQCKMKLRREKLLERGGGLPTDAFPWRPIVWQQWSRCPWQPCSMMILFFSGLIPYTKSQIKQRELKGSFVDKNFIFCFNIFTWVLPLFIFKHNIFLANFHNNWHKICCFTLLIKNCKINT